MTLKKNKNNESGQQFWSYVERTAARVKDWPEWKRGVAEKPTPAAASESKPAPQPDQGGGKKG